MAKTPSSAVEDYLDEKPSDSEPQLNAVPPPPGRLVVKRNGHSITRQIPKPVVLIDTREKTPFDLRRFTNWISETKRLKINAGDYSVGSGTRLSY